MRLLSTEKGLRKLEQTRLVFIFLYAVNLIIGGADIWHASYTPRMVLFAGLGGFFVFGTAIVRLFFQRDLFQFEGKYIGTFRMLFVLHILLCLDVLRTIYWHFF